MKAVLVVDRDQSAREVLERLFTRAGFRTTVLPFWPSDLASVLGGPFAIIVFSPVPGEHISERANTLARLGGRSGLVVLDSCPSQAAMISALESGADDYVAKPFAPREVLARTRALARRCSAPVPEAPAAAIHIGELTIDIAGRRVTVGGQQVALTRIEFELLAWMASRPGIVHSRKLLLQSVWGRDDTYGDTSTVTVHVRRLRSKLQAHPQLPQLIHTSHGVGYHFQPPVPIADPGSGAAAAV